MKLIPKPIVTGFTAGIAVYIFSTQVGPGVLPSCSLLVPLLSACFGGLGVAVQQVGPGTWCSCVVLILSFLGPFQEDSMWEGSVGLPSLGGAGRGQGAK